MKSDEIQLGDVTWKRSTQTVAGPGGEPIDLRNKSRQVLAFLADNPDRIVTKEEILDDVWPDVTVGDESLVQCIADIRRIIGKDAKRIVVAVPRQGYRLQPSNPSVASSRTWKAGLPAFLALVVLTFVGSSFWFLGAATKPAPAPPTIAVLPFQDLSLGPNKGALGDILSEGIITDLARYPHFRVIAQNSSFRFRDAGADAGELRDILGADYVLKGSQLYDGTHVRVSVHLIETRGGTYVFTDRIDRELGDVFSAQDEIVKRVAAVTGEQVIASAPRLRDATDVSALLLYMRARAQMQHYSKENWEKAIALDRQSLAQFPESPWGYIGLAFRLQDAAGWGWSDRSADDLLSEAEALSDKALEIAPSNYEAHFARARVHERRGEHQESLLHFERAVALNPSASKALIGMSVPLLYLGETGSCREVGGNLKAA